MKKVDKRVKILFVFRVLLWIIAAGATIYWIYWSFHLYTIGIHIVNDYATVMRPILYKSVAVSAVAILISFKLHAISEKIKKEGEEQDGRV